MEQFSVEKFINRKNLNSQESGNLILFNYSKICQFERDWDEITLWARGIVFDKNTQKAVCVPFKKFFNFQESECLEVLKNIFRDEPFEVTTKEDGSLILLFFHNGVIKCITRGSFQSSQAHWALDWVTKNIDITKLDQSFTYLCEGIYPSNRIVINYNGKEALILLSAIHNETWKEAPYTKVLEMGSVTGLEVVKRHQFNSLKDIEEMCLTLDADHEGFVINYPRLNFRFKMKGSEYCKVHSLISNITPLSFWRATDYENTLEIPVSYMAGLPEEFRETSDLLKYHIEKLHKDLFNKIKSMAESCPKEFESKFARYTYMMETFGELGSMVLAFVEGKLWKVSKFVHDEIRPRANVIPGVDLTRIDRIINNDG